MPSFPRLYHHDTRLVQWADRLIAKIIGGELGGLELSNILYVDVNGDDATGARGNVDKPYATVAAAMADAQSGDVIQLGAGVFSEPTINWKTSVSGVKLQGLGQGATLISESSGTGPAIAVVPLATESVQVVVIENLRVVNNDAATYAINIDGSIAGAGAGGAIGLVKLHELLVTNSGGNLSLRVATAEQVDVDTVDTDLDNILLEEVGEGTVRDLNVNGYAIDYDLAEVTPAGRGAIAHTGCLITALTVSNHAWAAFGKECQAGGIVAALVDDAVLGSGRIDYTGRVVNGVAVTFDFQNDPGSGYRQDCISFDHADIGTTFSVSDQGASTVRVYATARQAIFRTTTNQTITAGPYCDLDLRGALFDQEALEVTVDANNGTIDRSIWTQLRSAAAGILPETLAFANAGGAIPYPVQTGGGQYTYTVSCELQAAADGAVTITAKNANGEDFTYDTVSTPNQSGDITFTVNRPFNRLG